MFNHFLTDLRTNLRMRLWLALIVGALALYGILVMREQLQKTQQEQRIVAQSITRLKAQITQVDWLQRQEPANILAAQLESRLWQAPTAGLAQAAFQDWLNATVQQTKATRPMVTVTVVDEIAPNASLASVSPDPTAPPEGSAPTPADLWKIKAKVGFDLSVPVLLEFLRRIETHDKQIIISMLDVRKEPLAHVEMDLTAYFQQQKPAAKP